LTEAISDMSADLVLVHGRSQQEKDANALKAEWLTALAEGLRKNNLTIPIAADRIRFPYYGDTLFALAKGRDDVPKIEVRGDPFGVVARDFSISAEDQFFLEVAREIHSAVGSRRDQPVNETGTVRAVGAFQPFSPLQNVLRALDRLLPAGSTLALEVITRDVYRYLTNSRIREQIELGIAQAITPGTQTVVVAHSLGSVVAYNLLRREGHLRGWNISLLVTVGSPLAITPIRRILEFLAPLSFPQCVGAWHNARDLRDIVALHALDPENLPLTPALHPIDNNNDVDNKTANRHGISGYLDDKSVARRIFGALTP
jgi:hypothetical protein